MFDRLFRHPHALARHRDGPLAEERCRYLAHCAAQQMAVWTLRHIANYILVVAKVLHLADRPAEVISPEEIKAEAKRWARHRSQPPQRQILEHARQCFQRHALRWLQFLGRLQRLATAPRPYAEQIAQFTDYQLRERGLSPNTVERDRQTLHRFLSQLEQSGRHLQTLSITQVDELLATKIGEEKWTRRYLGTWVSILRPFLRFAEGRGWCHAGLADALMVPRVFRYESLPVGPSWEDVKRLLAAAEGGRPVDVRDRAVLLLLAVYGLRAGEVAALSLGDFDWTQEMLTVQHGKSRRPRVYPLCRPVGDAVLRYLREVRPRCAHREVFLTMRAPFVPLTWSVGMLVRRRLQALGLTLPHYGRADEAAHVQVSDLTLPQVPDRDLASVFIRGKGNKPRQCPLWAQTVRELTALVQSRGSSEHVFLNRCGQAITRFGIHALVERYAARAAKEVPSLTAKRVSPHTIRHTTATHLLRSGVDINTIRAWLGHVSLTTTNVYAEVDLEMKAKALANCEVDERGSTTPWKENRGLMDFLRTL